MCGKRFDSSASEGGAVVWHNLRKAFSKAIRKGMNLTLPSFDKTVKPCAVMGTDCIPCILLQRMPAQFKQRLCEGSCPRERETMGELRSSRWGFWEKRKRDEMWRRENMGKREEIRCERCDGNKSERDDRRERRKRERGQKMKNANLYLSFFFFCGSKFFFLK